ncbi:hypothetical protein C8F04DRAFT_137923 [Mycena alexandri]|uniref:MYND-type domain-containing protein n=1 Tax=Mycena alexandri TaxID=1745969 RepID=A0AAD6SCV0_9AGAR|nr:hypothetical protein C8F04DRAFT_137923 [Mycena alexandri]
MRQPKSGSICEFDMCPLQDEIDSASTSLMRCSRCKNRFYCSAKCQKSDWKAHQWNCSVLPVDDVPAATVIEIDDEFKAEVARVVAILKEVAALKVEQGKLSATMLAPLLKIISELPERFHYKQRIQDSDKFKYRLPIITACRLLLIDYVSALDEARRQKYEKFFTTMEVPTSWCAIYGPKIVARPADLSPGEYDMLSTVMPMWVMPEIESAKAEKKKQMEKDAAEENAAEESEGMQWVWLAVLMKRVYNVKSG